MGRSTLRQPGDETRTRPPNALLTWLLVGVIAGTVSVVAIPMGFGSGVAAVALLVWIIATAVFVAVGARLARQRGESTWSIIRDALRFVFQFMP